jgi:DNA-binding transcriptional regulator YiaG
VADDETSPQEARSMAMPAAPMLDVESVRAGLGVSRERMGRLLDVAAKTIDRWEKGRALPGSERRRQELAQLAEIAELGRAVFTAAGFRRFLMTPLPAFGGRSALAAIEAGEADRVLGLLAGLYEGEPG